MDEKSHKNKTILHGGVLRKEAALQSGGAVVDTCVSLARLQQQQHEQAVADVGIIF